MGDRSATMPLCSQLSTQVRCSQTYRSVASWHKRHQASHVSTVQLYVRLDVHKSLETHSVGPPSSPQQKGLQKIQQYSSSTNPPRGYAPLSCIQTCAARPRVPAICPKRKTHKSSLAVHAWLPRGTRQKQRRAARFSRPEWRPPGGRYLMGEFQS